MADGSQEARGWPGRHPGHPRGRPGLRYHFADLTLDTGLRRVTRVGESIPLGRLSYQMLQVLVESAPNVVSQDEFSARVWGGRFVTPETVTQRVKLLRDALRDRAESPRYIGLVRGHGYRLLQAVQTAESASSRLGRLAVLPFETFSLERRDAIYADGLHEELLTCLAALRTMRILARTSVMQYAGARQPIVEIADALGVGWVMEGSIRHAAERVRITAQLIDGFTGDHVWADVYERSAEPIFETQTEVVTQIAASVGSDVFHEKNA